MKSGFVSIIGRPNVGKSTLMNTIIGEKIAIVTDKPQTTRTRIQGIYTCEQGQIIFVDTPGIHKPKHLLGEYMVKASTRTIGEADIILYIVDVTRPFGGGERFIVEQIKDSAVPVFLLVNKIDLVEEKQIQEYIQVFSNHMSFSEIIPISATKGTNMDDFTK